MQMRHLVMVAVFSMLVLYACSPAGGEKRGHEFMPDMVHSTAYESNLYNYYFFNTWGTEEDYKKYAQPRKPVAGTIPRGFGNAYSDEGPAGAMHVSDQFEGRTSQNAVAYTPNGHVPYYYDDTEDERNRAIAEITENPFPITESGLERGEALYNVYCAICHGEKGDGLGYLVREGDPARGITAGVYPAAPANFLQADFYNASNGRFYHAIMYGKNVMGPHADKLSYEERWQVIHWIRSLQAKEQGMDYSEEANTFGHGTPGSEVADAMPAHDDEMPMEEGAHEEHGSEDSHGGDHH